MTSDTENPSDLRRDPMASEEDPTFSRAHGSGLFTISHFKVLEKIGAGGMGEVFLAEDLRLRRRVALKLLPEELTQDVARRERFVREARAAAAIEHPNIAVVHDIDEADGRTFIAMEYVQGDALRELIAGEKLTLARALELAEQIAGALAKVHEHGIVHRDLKPENILLSRDGFVKVIDFGLAKLLEPVPQHPFEHPAFDIEEQGTELKTVAGRVMGTAAYMSPEQARGEAVDARSDIFSFGAVLYELVTGECPFRRKNVVETLSAILRDSPSPLTLSQGKTPVDLKRVIERCLAKEPADRYQTMGDVAIDLRQLRETLEGKSPSLTWRQFLVSFALVAVLLSSTYWWARRDVAPVGAQEPVSVLIADFVNQTGDPVFDGALEEALGIGLEGASFITAYDRPRARRQAAELTPEVSGNLDASRARLVCRSQGIKVVISGSIEPREQGYVVRARAFDPVTEATVSEAETRVGSKAEVLRAADELSSRLRRDLGDGTTASAAAMDAETFTAASIDAMNLYAHAQELVSAGEYEEAETEFERAIEADPSLGRAYSGLAVLYFNQGERDASQRAFDEAMARMDRMSEREKLRTRGGYFVLRGSFRTAVDELTRLVEQYPADVAGHNNLALAHFYLRDMDRAAEHARRGLEIYPKNVVMRNNLALFAMYAGNFESAIREATAVLEENPSFIKAYVAMGLSRLATGAPADARSSYERLAELGGRAASFAAAGLADLALFQGRTNDAVSLLREAIEADLSSGFDSTAARKLTSLAEALLDVGDEDGAVGAVDRALQITTGAAVAVPAASVFLRTGHEDRALALASELGSRVQPELQANGKLIEAEAALQRGEPLAAVQALREGRTLADGWLIRYALGRAYIAAEAFPEAHAELELALKRHGEATAVFLDDVPSYHVLPPVHYHLGRVQEELRSPQSAIDSYTAFLEAKESGDGTDPLVADALRRLEALR